MKQGKRPAANPKFARGHQEERLIRRDDNVPAVGSGSGTMSQQIVDAIGRLYAPHRQESARRLSRQAASAAADEERRDALLKLSQIPQLPLPQRPPFPEPANEDEWDAWTDYRLWLARRMAIQGLDLALQGVHDPMILGLIRLVDELAREHEVGAWQRLRAFGALP